MPDPKKSPGPFGRKAHQLIRENGRTFAQEAGIRMADTPSPLYRTLVMTTLLSIPIRASVGVDAAKELFKAGFSSPKAMAQADWQDLVDALGRAHYRRYDESTATALGAGAHVVIDRWHGDLRKLREEAKRDPGRIRQLLQEMPRIGPVGAEIFCREAQGVWPELRPSFDRRALSGARKYHLPDDPERLASLVEPNELPNLAAALVRSTL
jgi:hypothetical protein